MVDEYKQPQLHRCHEAEEEGAKECFDESKNTITFATADADVATGETKDRGLFGFAGKAEEAKKKGEDELEDKTTVCGFAGKVEEAEKKGEDELDKTTVCETTDEVVENENAVEATDRGLFGSFMGKKKAEGEDVNKVTTEFEKVNVSEEQEEKKEEKKLQKSNSSSSSSSSDEEEDGMGEEKKKKKKDMKDKIKEMVPGGGDQKEEEKPEIKKLDKKVEEAAYVEPAEVANAEAGVDQAQEKKGFVDEMEEKLPVPEQTRGTEDDPTTHPPKAEEAYTQEPEQEKKGIFQKIKEKIPGYQTKSANNEGA